MVWTDFAPFSVGHVVDEVELNQFLDNLDLLHSAHTVKAYLTANTSFTYGIQSVVSMTSEDYDSDGYHSTSVNTSRLTVPSGLDGLYIIHAQIHFAAGGSDITPRTLELRLNGLTFPLLATSSGGSDATQGARPSVTTMATLAAGDYIEMFGLQLSGIALNALAGNADTYLEMVWRGKL